MTKKILPWLGVLIMLLAGCGVRQPSVAPVVGAIAPDFGLENLAGETVHLSDYRGHVVLLNFWATWCGPCLVEMPDIQTYYDKYTPDLVVLGINFDESPPIVKAYVEELGLTFPILLDKGGIVQEEYQVRGYPSTYVVDKEGIVRVVHIGILLPEQIEEYLETGGIQLNN